ncbi:ParB/Srx family N-terminal domain-containing protein [Pseudoxanthobacter sp. M-2]|uniref:ParB/Srx family N-terminal domain-containing protein n=1 Tax=Pseudoxanthobacter sp. M-2 TaxID=3078754 RepID=UPI0038FCC798
MPATSPRLPDAIEHWPVDRLRPYGRNPRAHDDDQIAQIAASIIEFGWTNPVLVSADGDVIAGHGRLEAARRLSLDTVPVVILDHLTLAQRRAYVIADNQLALNAGWDEARLSAELQDLLADDFDLSLVGFSDGEIESFWRLCQRATQTRVMARAAAFRRWSFPSRPAIRWRARATYGSSVSIGCSAGTRRSMRMSAA